MQSLVQYFFWRDKKKPIHSETLCFYMNDGYGIISNGTGSISEIIPWKVEIYVVEPDLSPQEMYDFVENLPDTD